MGGAKNLLTDPNWNADIFELLNVVSPFRNRVIADGGEMILDAGEIAALMPLGDWSWFYVPAGRKAGTSYAQIPGSAGDLSVTRASVANENARNGLLSEVAANVGRLDFLNGVFQGQPIEPTAINQIRNNTMVGAVAGTPGTLPNNWTVPSTAGLSRQIVAVGIENGVEFVDVRFFGTANSVISALRFESPTFIVSSQGQQWTHSLFMRQIAWTLPPNQLLVSMCENTAAGVYQTEGSVNVRPSLTTTLTRFAFTRTLTSATAARVEPVLQFALTNGASYGFTIRIGLPQMELGSVATSAIRTSGTIATRQADVFTRTGASGLIGSGGLTLYAEINSRLTGGANAKRILTLTDGTANNVVALEKTTTDTIRALVINGGVEQMSVISGTAPTGNIRVAAGVGVNDGVLFVNGTQIGTDTSLAIPSGLNRIDLGQSSLGALHLNDRNRAAGISQRRWTNAELAQLTSL